MKKWVPTAWMKDSEAEINRTWVCGATQVEIPDPPLEEPERRIEKCVVKKSCGVLKYIREELGMSKLLSEAVNDPEFMCYKYWCMGTSDRPRLKQSNEHVASTPMEVHFLIGGAS